jgi:hypothetical protein
VCSDGRIRCQYSVDFSFMQPNFKAQDIFCVGIIYAHVSIICVWICMLDGSGTCAWICMFELKVK